jgi:3-methyl-2-oxobutanoate hydroxymethyltransferase
VTDFLGLGSFIPRHARPYADLRGTILAAAAAYRADVEAGTFPGAAQSSRMDDTVLDEVLGHSPDDRTGEGTQRIEAGIPLDRDL